MTQYCEGKTLRDINTEVKGKYVSHKMCERIAKFIFVSTPRARIHVYLCPPCRQFAERHIRGFAVISMTTNKILKRVANGGGRQGTE